MLTARSSPPQFLLSSCRRKLPCLGQYSSQACVCRRPVYPGYRTVSTRLLPGLSHSCIQHVRPWSANCRDCSTDILPLSVARSRRSRAYLLISQSSLNYRSYSEHGKPFPIQKIVYEENAKAIQNGQPRRSHLMDQEMAGRPEDRGSSKDMSKTSSEEALQKRMTHLKREIKRLRKNARRTKEPNSSAKPITDVTYLAQGTSRKQGLPTHSQEATVLKETAKPTSTSLLEMIFPEEAAKREAKNFNNLHGLTKNEDADVSSLEEEFPRLDLLSLGPEKEHTSSEENQKSSLVPPSKSSTQYFKEQDLVVMIIDGLKTSLSVADFQRIIPRGKHIEEWRAPGDVLKVIPIRNHVTLEHKGGYILVFINPEYANAYKLHLEHVHELSRQKSMALISATYVAPTDLDLDSYFEGINTEQVLKDYTLCPPSQNLSCRILSPPYNNMNIRRVLAAKGYEQFTQPEDTSFRSVLVSVENHDPTAFSVKRWLKQDGFRRGLAWSASSEFGRFRRLANSALTVSKNTIKEDEPARTADQATASAARTWIVTFNDEAEARRFVRAWHRMSWPVDDLNDVDDMREGAPMVNAELLW